MVRGRLVLARRDAGIVLGQRGRENHGPGHALVSLRSAQHRPFFTEAMLAAMFKLSPTQASIALAIFNGQTPEEVALERGIKITTLRTHLAASLCARARIVSATSILSTACRRCAERCQDMTSLRRVNKVGTAAIVFTTGLGVLAAAKAAE